MSSALYCSLYATVSGSIFLTTSETSFAVISAPPLSRTSLSARLTISRYSPSSANRISSSVGATRSTTSSTSAAVMNFAPLSLTSLSARVN